MKTFYLLGEVNSSSLGIIASIREHHQHLLAKKVPFEDRTINVVISSEGGDENVGYAIFDTLMAYRKFGTVITSGYGQVCSIASLILQGGDSRYLSPNCMFMIHNGHIHVQDTVDDRVLEEMRTYFKNNNQRYYSNIAKRCGVPVDRVRDWCNDETFFTADEAVKAKLADKISKGL